MGIDSLLCDPSTKVKATITRDNELKVINTPYPTLDVQKSRPFRQYLSDNGLVSGSFDMNVDGSSTNQQFFVQSVGDDDRHITQLSFIVAYSSSGSPYEFGDSTALTNGVRIFYESIQGEYDIHDSINSNQDFFRLSFSLIPTAWEVRHVNALNDFGYFINLDLTKMGFPYGIKLDMGTQQKLAVVIRDNVTANLDTFNCIAYGFDRFE